MQSSILIKQKLSFPAKFVYNIHQICYSSINHLHSNINLESTHALQHDFVYYMRPLWKFIGDKETHIQTTHQDFDSSDFIGHLKSPSEMTPCGMLLDLV